MRDSTGGSDKNPSCISFEVRVQEKASNDFKVEKLSVPGHVPLPTMPPTWAGGVPNKAETLSTLKAELKVATVTSAGDLLIPLDEDVPVKMTSELRETLERFRKQFPRPVISASAPEEASSTSPACPKLSHQELQQQKHIAKVIPMATLNLLIVAPAVDQLEVEELELWCHNPSSTRRANVDAGAFLVGLEQCCVRRATDPKFEPTGPCTVRWSFHKPGSKEQTNASGEKDVNADTARIWTIPKGGSELQQMSIASALKACNAYPSGTIWGFKTVTDSKRNVTLKPTEILYVQPAPVAIVDANVNNVGYFIGLRAAMNPDVKTEYVKPELVVHLGEKKATLCPKQNSSAIRFVAAKAIHLGIDQCMRLF